MYDYVCSIILYINNNGFKGIGICTYYFPDQV